MMMWLFSPRAAGPLLAAALALGAAAPASAQPQEFDAVRAAHPSTYAELLDRQGRVLTRRRVDLAENRLGWTPLADMSPALAEAVIFAEDRDFYRHHGIDWGAAARAGWGLVSGHRGRGASTLSMQLAGLLDPALGWRTGGRSLSQKWRQMQEARTLESRWSKPQILEAYLNLSQFRGDLGGVAAASAALFDKAPSGLDRNEALLLASLLPAPTASPSRVAAHGCRLIQAGFTGASCERLQFLAATRLDRRRLSDEDTPELAALAWRYLSASQRQVRTTLDADLQAYARERLRAQLAGLHGREVTAGAALVLDNASGEVLAYVANAGLQAEGRYVDAVTAPRQAGSTLKPFLYALAFEKRLLTAASPLRDEPLSLPTPQGLYSPQNYDKDFKGVISARTALASSLNVPAVRVQLLAGGEDFWTRLRDLGFSLPEAPEFYGYGLALGDADVSLWQLANAYRTLARGGVWSSPVLIPSLSRPAERTVAEPGAAFITADILADRQARALTFEFENPLATPFWTAVKTGTSKDMRDNWCIGFSQRHTVAVWVGNLDGAPMRDVSGITGAAPVWAELMQRLEGGRWQAEAPRPAPPPGLVRQTVSFDGVPEPAREEWFLPDATQSTVTYVGDRRVHILSPVNETVYALDPDIPPGHQQVTFRAAPDGARLSWWLDGKRLGAATARAWSPQPGHFRLSLRDEAGVEQDAVVFTVRGGWKGRDSP
ncbi:MAG: penicillin-binding protein 1C [Fluviicoccus sp.]|uniref:penicillin-binding protein 1C n=1 Tax=Fluviicoccus sp. TaxID=2003552 RepID=UPI0027162BF1|nr:penicillin-binding protein 1C [Fluviicoccus sp.]MDO8332225.1 penicillin-binding protein 1C [Fluviicoccus sp.]